jgi:hypothetical protein
MQWLELNAWWGLFATAVIIVVFGITDVFSGAAADPAIPLGLTGMTLDELEAESPTVFMLYDTYTRVNGVGGVLIGLLFSSVLWFGFRRNQRWAWWTMWLLPIWALGILAFYLVIGVQPDQPPPPPMISGPIIGVLCAAILLVSAPRFFREGGTT